jgi:hypothetical protein
MLLFFTLHGCLLPMVPMVPMVAYLPMEAMLDFGWGVWAGSAAWCTACSFRPSVVCGWNQTLGARHGCSFLSVKEFE